MQEPLESVVVQRPSLQPNQTETPTVRSQNTFKTSPQGMEKITIEPENHIPLPGNHTPSPWTLTTVKRTYF